MTDPINIKPLSTRVGLSSNAIFRLWRAAVKDDEKLLDEAIAAVHDQTMSLDPARAERVISLIIRRHRDAKCAFRAHAQCQQEATTAPQLCRFCVKAEPIRSHQRRVRDLRLRS